MNGALDDRVASVRDASPDTLRLAENWRKHVVRAGSHSRCVADEADPDQHREQIEPWLSALFQAEHLNVLVGGGLPAPTLVEIREIPDEYRPHSPDPAFWDVWTGEQEREVDWPTIVRTWQGVGAVPE